MPLRIFGDATSGFSLHDDNDVRIGWIDGRALGFRCFADLDAAAAGARVAYTALVSWSARLGGTQPLPDIGESELRLVNDGAYTWFASGQVPVARVLTPRADVARDHGLHAIELILPRGVGPVAAIGGAQAIYSALVRELRGAVVHPAAPIGQEADDETYADAPDVA
ncbi:MAG TPA: hypothetical protein VGT98_07200 [Candidatus Elarobacter sp.]|nr:hypothetical protein [Candidatus Elarobacter sp.]